MPVTTRARRHNLANGTLPTPPIPGDFRTPSQRVKGRDDDESSLSSLDSGALERSSVAPPPGLLFGDGVAGPAVTTRSRAAAVKGGGTSKPTVPASRIPVVRPAVSSTSVPQVNKMSFSSTPKVVSNNAERREKAAAPQAEEPGWTKVNHGKKRPATIADVRETIKEPEPPVREKAKGIIINEPARGSHAAAEKAEAAPPKVAFARERSLSRGEGSSNMSKAQGKTIDPRNWGAVGIDPEELDPELQRKLLQAYQEQMQTEEVVDEDDELDLDAQQALLESYTKLKEEQRRRKGEQAKAARREELLAELRELGVNVDAVGEDNGVRVFKQEEEETKFSAPRESTTQPDGAREASAAPLKDSGKSTKGKEAPKKKSTVTKSQSSSGKDKGNGTYPVRKHGSALDPAAQVDPNSYLGQTFRNLRARSEPVEGDSDDDEPPALAELSDSEGNDADDGGSEPPSDDDSDDDGGSSSGGSSSSSSSSSDDENRGTSSKDKKKKKKSKSKKKKAKKPKLPAFKPREPEKYNGKPDVQAFHKFVQECEAYVDGYDLDESKYASTISYFLTGTAYEFYSTLR